MMPGGSEVQVLYFVPEDGDVEKHPNVFSVAEKTGKGVRLGKFICADNPPWYRWYQEFETKI